jgi:large subunit ribosomal protein L17
MPKPTKGPRLGSGPAHQRLMLGGLAAALIREERIRTTEAKAKLLRPMADRLVTLGKAGTVHARRRALMVIEDSEVVHKLFAEVAPRFSERSGGYTRVLKLGPRKGDAAPMAIVEFVEELDSGTTASAAPASKRRGLRRRKKEEEPEGTGGSPKAARGRTAAAASEKSQTEPDRSTELAGATEAVDSQDLSDEGAEVFMTGETEEEPAEDGEAAGESDRTP